jgi:hypothetical protein
MPKTRKASFPKKAKKCPWARMGAEPARSARFSVQCGATRSPALPSHVDLRSFCSKVEDQGHLGSCTANQLAGALEFLK